MPTDDSDNRGNPLLDRARLDELSHTIGMAVLVGLIDEFILEIKQLTGQMTYLAERGQPAEFARLNQNLCSVAVEYHAVALAKRASFIAAEIDHGRISDFAPCAGDLNVLCAETIVAYRLYQSDHK